MFVLQPQLVQACIDAQFCGSRYYCITVCTLWKNVKGKVDRLIHVVPQHQVKKAKYCQSSIIHSTGPVISETALSMCEPSVVGPNPLLHQIIPASG